MSKSFEQIFSESNPHGFNGYEGPCTCCEPKSTDKVTKAYARGVQEEQARIINLLINLDAIRRDALGHLVAFNTHGTEVIYLDGLESK